MFKNLVTVSSSPDSKRREVIDQHLDSTRWNDFEYRPKDIVIATYPKAGTTWMQQIVGQLLFDGKPGIPVVDRFAWLESPILPLRSTLKKIERQGQRCLKTHLPSDALPICNDAKYIFVGRDGRDTLLSLYEHHMKYTPWLYERLNAHRRSFTPPFERPSTNVEQYFHHWLDFDGVPYHSFWDMVLSWWSIRSLPNVKVVHFCALINDLEGQIRDIAEFLDIEISRKIWPAIIKHCSFGYMKERAQDLSSKLDLFLIDGARSLINKGVEGRWKDIFNESDVEKYEQLAGSRLGSRCARWLASGDGDSTVGTEYS